LSTIQRMDRIVVLEDGAIKEHGSHAELLTRAGSYAQLWSHQSGGFINPDDTEAEPTSESDNESGTRVGEPQRRKLLRASK
jgi:hypothetical protein